MKRTYEQNTSASNVTGTASSTTGATSATILLGKSPSSSNTRSDIQNVAEYITDEDKVKIIRSIECHVLRLLKQIAKDTPTKLQIEFTPIESNAYFDLKEQQFSNRILPNRKESLQTGCQNNEADVGDEHQDNHISTSSEDDSTETVGRTKRNSLSKRAKQSPLSSSSSFNNSQFQKHLRYRLLTFQTNPVLFTCAICTLSLAYECVRSGTIISKRNLFYRTVSFNDSQLRSNQSIDIVCSLLQLPRHYLGIIASNRALIKGPLYYSLKDHPHTFLSAFNGAHISPESASIVNINSSAQYALIVEKESIYTQLSTSSFTQKNECIIITSKGFPCLAARWFLTRLTQTYPTLPIYILVDADPWGMQIFCNYMYGSAPSSLDCLGLHNAKLVGVYVSDILHFADSSTRSLCFQQLTSAEIQRIRTMLSTPHIHKNFMLKSNLEDMLKLKVKAEIESLSNFGTNFLVDVYIPYKIRQFTSLNEGNVTAS